MKYSIKNWAVTREKMSDVPAPFTEELPEYQKWENRLFSMIYEKCLGSDLTANMGRNYSIG